MARTDFIAKITEASRELDKRMQLKLTNTGSAVKLDKAVTNDQTLRIAPTGWAIVDVHNENARDDKDYQQYIVMTEDKNYITGSNSFWNSFINIFETMDGEPFEIEIFKMPSKNYEGKTFLTCDIV